MAEKKPQTSKKLIRIGAILIGLAILGVFAVVGGFAYAANQESHDPFCGSCHTQPETSYLERSTSAQQVDLASYHTTQNTKCIDCHSGKGVFGRIKAELEGAAMLSSSIQKQQFNRRY
jgi:nitrate/TMAO reductase-like tetraheme cytochrome c subunit